MDVRSRRSKIPRQYARFCGIVHGEKTRKFFAKLVRLQYAIRVNPQLDTKRSQLAGSPSG